MNKFEKNIKEDNISGISYFFIIDYTNKFYCCFCQNIRYKKYYSISLS